MRQNEIKPVPLLLRTIPSHEDTTPRDGKLISDTQDILFIAALLNHIKDARVAEYTDPASRGKYAYCLESPGGALLDPVSGGERLSPPPGKRARMLNASTVRGFFRTKFYLFRQHLLDSESDMTLELRGRIIKSGCSVRVKPNAILPEWQALPRLADDAVLGALHQIEWLRNVPSETPTEEDRAICPLCGPVEMCEGSISSSKSTWAARVGRKVDCSMCPTCLGVFEKRFGGMN